MGSGIMVRAFAQAYRQALANASKSGVAHETVQNIRRGSKMISEPEARQILGITEHSTWEEILQKYDKLFENNAKNGSFYLQSKRSDLECSSMYVLMHPPETLDFIELSAMKPS
ncbi:MITOCHONDRIAL IMPORT INNER MEMBRANE TRANSLOCASE SUBUNIT PAM16 LIKE 1 [Salix viminalis]|uniref:MITOCHONDRIAL IMPORT INNER MEMBRANE TRANSLOCASE SUBUNIT PAM16 LIKE 1 n=1 Tax=Salix viminalis TaxID=40686 RepID=A0A9Q0NM16_SALVM|nr:MITOCHONDRIAL IMPORT INNER MEMBRANE TRANSLOCASE SUBUNIT PAM16 LIKE 1 [Salix viminalis]